MDLNSFFQFLVPKDRKFFPLFEQNGQHIVAGAKILVKVLHEEDMEIRQMHIKELVKQEAKCDQQTEALISLLHSSFITPFDREDVYALINLLQKTIHYIARSAKRIEVYHLSYISPDVQKLGELVMESTEELHKMLVEMNGNKQSKKILKLRSNIAKLERKSDEVYSRAVQQLFKTETNSIELIKNKEVLSAMENTLDKIDEAARIIESVLIKSA